MTISWAGGNDYCIGKVDGKEIFYVEREGPRWLAFDWRRPDSTVGEPVAINLTMRQAQAVVERQFEAV